ncbi:MAG: DNA-directed RNA polymerase subunit delta [Firmicutes bacterium]|nr:DNA-directed RNA polymerase subunit delta [Bacillota bacterium]
MAYQTMTDVAYNCLSKRKRAMDFLKLYEEVVKKMEIPENLQKKKRAQFYSELMLDNRFTSLKDNKWDLRARYTFDETHIDTDAIEIDDDEIFEDEIIENEEDEEDNDKTSQEDDYE